MKEPNPVAVHLSDYRPPAYYIDTTTLHVSLLADCALVSSRLLLRRGSGTPPGTPLRLDGQRLQLQRICLDGRELAPAEYRVDNDHLEIASVPAQFELDIVTRIFPRDNTALEGLYRSRTMYCTQCEAEGFRRITWYLDRPDVLSQFTTTVEADRAECPVLLSNGNLVASGELPGGRHWATWEDPFPKPCYLFALVAGDLECVADSFVTCSGRKVDLRLYVEPKDVDKCDHALASLKNAMRWDEQVYGREYDLDNYMIVAVDDFNMGAMENKGLNIFNTSCVLAHPQTTTDAGFQRVEAVVAHEYFHNWSGNRVTCRDWFQLSLKEGFTVFRDAEFSADMGSRTVKRVEDVTLLRTMQFAEDAGPMAHPVRPESYIEINNFYTLTVYEKGSEVVRMLHQLLGPALFRAGTDLYFARHDGQAVTCDDFVAAMAEVSGRDLGVFKRWYSQSGTPVLKARGKYDPAARSYRLVLEQECPPTPGQDRKQPFLIPVRVALVGAEGEMAARLRGESEARTEWVLELEQSQQEFLFEGVASEPVPSLLRDFSAPVRLDVDHSPEQLLFLVRHDSDGFVRWDACQSLATRTLQNMVEDLRQARAPALDPCLVEVLGKLLQDPDLDPAMLALMLTLPSEAYLAEEAQVIFPREIHRARQVARQQLAIALQAELVAARERNAVSGDYVPRGEQVGRRSLRNACLLLLAELPGKDGVELAVEQLADAGNMTDRLAALTALVYSAHVADLDKTRALDEFYRQWQHESLVVNQWLQVQAANPLPGGLERVQHLLSHPGFSLDNPNKLRALVGGFSNQNAVNFHRDDGAGYDFLVDVISRLNDTNPQIGARLLTPLTRWRRYAAGPGQAMRQRLERLRSLPVLAPEIYEVVSKSLA